MINLLCSSLPSSACVQALPRTAINFRPSLPSAFKSPTFSLKIRKNTPEITCAVNDRDLITPEERWGRVMEAKEKLKTAQEKRVGLAEPLISCSPHDVTKHLKALNDALQDEQLAVQNLKKSEKEFYTRLELLFLENVSDGRNRFADNDQEDPLTPEELWSLANEAEEKLNSVWKKRMALAKPLLTSSPYDVGKHLKALDEALHDEHDAIGKLKEARKDFMMGLVISNVYDETCQELWLRFNEAKQKLKINEAQLISSPLRDGSENIHG